jgi:hypothetical protein
LEFATPFHEAVTTMILARAGIFEASQPRPGNDNAGQSQPAYARPSRREQILAGIAVPPAPLFVAHQLPPR